MFGEVKPFMCCVTFDAKGIHRGYSPGILFDDYNGYIYKHIHNCQQWRKLVIDGDPIAISQQQHCLVMKSLPARKVVNELHQLMIKCIMLDIPGNGTLGIRIYRWFARACLNHIVIIHFQGSIVFTLHICHESTESTAKLSSCPLFLRTELFGMAGVANEVESTTFPLVWRAWHLLACHLCSVRHLRDMRCLARDDSGKHQHGWESYHQPGWLYPQCWVNHQSSPAPRGARASDHTTCLALIVSMTEPELPWWSVTVAITHSHDSTLLAIYWL